MCIGHVPSRLCWKITFQLHNYESHIFTIILRLISIPTLQGRRFLYAINGDRIQNRQSSCTIHTTQIFWETTLLPQSNTLSSLKQYNANDLEFYSLTVTFTNYTYTKNRRLRHCRKERAIVLVSVLHIHTYMIVSIHVNDRRQAHSFISCTTHPPKGACTGVALTSSGQNNACTPTTQINFLNACSQDHTQTPNQRANQRNPPTDQNLPSFLRCFPPTQTRDDIEPHPHLLHFPTNPAHISSKN